MKRYMMIIMVLMAMTMVLDAKAKVVTRKEVTIGVVKNNRKDGRVLSDKEIIRYSNGTVKVIRWKVNKNYDYISYRGVKCCKGNIIKTVCVMNPNNREPDDIITRKDKVIKR